MVCTVIFMSNLTVVLRLGLGLGLGFRQKGPLNCLLTVMPSGTNYNKTLCLFFYIIPCVGTTQQDVFVYKTNVWRKHGNATRMKTARRWPSVMARIVLASVSFFAAQPPQIFVCGDASMKMGQKRW